MFVEFIPSDKRSITPDLMFAFVCRKASGQRAIRLIKSVWNLTVPILWQCMESHLASFGRKLYMGIMAATALVAISLLK